MNIKNIKGLKYPDEYFIKFFFKKGLHKIDKKKYLELGCSNGCNLMLPYQYNNSVLGVDMDQQSIFYANENFKILNQNTKFQFFNTDMRKFCKEQKNLYADVLILANSIYYIPEDDFINMLKNIIENKLIKENVPFFIRFREIDDFRNNKGVIIGKNSIIMKNEVTAEDGLFCKFYEKNEMINILSEQLNIRNFEMMDIRYDNIQNGIKVNNHDVVIWGEIN